jgi:hypothetical protein
MIQTKKEHEQLSRPEYKRQSSSKFPITKIVPASNIVKSDTKQKTVKK